MIIKLATGDKVKKQSDYYYETKNKEDGTVYKVHPSAFNSKELNVTTPDVTVTAPRPKGILLLLIQLLLQNLFLKHLN